MEGGVFLTAAAEPAPNLFPATVPHIRACNQLFVQRLCCDGPPTSRHLLDAQLEGWKRDSAATRCAVADGARLEASGRNTATLQLRGGCSLLLLYAGASAARSLFDAEPGPQLAELLPRVTTLWCLPAQPLPPAVLDRCSAFHMPRLAWPIVSR